MSLLGVVAGSPGERPFTRDDEGDLVFLWHEAHKACGLVCPIGKMTGMPPAPVDPWRQDAGLVTGMRIAWVQHALSALSGLHRLVLRHYYDPSSIPEPQREGFRSQGRIGPVMLITEALARAHEKARHGGGLAETFRHLCLAKSHGDRATMATALARLSQMRIEADALLFEARRAYARARSTEPVRVGREPFPGPLPRRVA